MELKQGQMLVDSNQRYFLVPEQNPAYHLDGMLIDLFSGEIVHFSHAKEPVSPVGGWEIMW